jgi:hypothetical protein
LRVGQQLVAAGIDHEQLGSRLARRKPRVKLVEADKFLQGLPRQTGVHRAEKATRAGLALGVIIWRSQHQYPVAGKPDDHAVARLELGEQQTKLVANMLGRRCQVKILEAALLGHHDHIVFIVAGLEEEPRQVFDVAIGEGQAG